MKKLDFAIPFSGFCARTFLNCFSSTYLYLEDYAHSRKDRKPCGSSTCAERVTDSIGSLSRKMDNTFASVSFEGAAVTLKNVTLISAPPFR